MPCLPFICAPGHLGGLNYNGQGVTQDYTEAVRWYKLAAAQGHASAQNNLGGCTAEDKVCLKIMYGPFLL
jgi:TPR repeat protein